MSTRIIVTATIALGVFGLFVYAHYWDHIAWWGHGLIVSAFMGVYIWIAPFWYWDKR